MKKMIAMLLIGGFLAAGVIGCGPAATTGDNKPAPSATETKTEGKVTKADAGKITVSGKDFTVPDEAKVMIDGADKKAADLKDVKADDKTTGTVVVDGSGKVKSVDVKTK